MRPFPVKRIAIAALLLSLAVLSPLCAIPPSFVDDSDGFLDFTVTVSWGIGDEFLTWGAEMCGAGPERIGFGFGATMGPGGLFAYLEGLYFWDPVASPLFTVPVKLRLGASLKDFEDIGFAVSLLGGCKLYPFLIRYDTDDGEDLGPDIGAYAALNWWNGRFFASVDADLGFVLSLTPDTGGGYYVYY
jgi:hypothetical protein